MATALTNLEVPASLRLLKAADGGRRGSIASGYRASFWLGRVEDQKAALWDARVDLRGDGDLLPGRSGDALLSPSQPDAWDRVEPGQVLAAFEGKRMIGYAVVDVSDGERGALGATHELRELLRSVEPHEFEQLVAALLKLTRSGVTTTGDDGLDLLVREGDRTLLFEVKGGDPPSFDAASNAPVSEMYVITQAQPRGDVLERLRTLATSAGVSAYWLTTMWVAERLVADEAIRKRFFGDEESELGREIRALRAQLAHDPLATGSRDLLLALNRRHPFLEWIVEVASVGSRANARLVPRERYPGALLEAIDESIR